MNEDFLKMDLGSQALILVEGEPDRIAEAGSFFISQKRGEKALLINKKDQLAFNTSSDGDKASTVLLFEQYCVDNKIPLQEDSKFGHSADTFFMNPNWRTDFINQNTR